MAAPAYDRTTYDGHTVNYRTRAMLMQAADFLGYSDGLTVLQGSYSNSVGASAGTHGGGGAVDLSAYQHERKVPVLRMVGFAAWYRPDLPGEWDEHIHCIAIGDKQMSDEARKQVQDYYAHLTGLSGHAHDDTWHPNPIVPFHYPLPYVDMSRVLRQIDGKLHEPLPGVKRIQRALNIKTGTHLAVDGWYGARTRDAYKRYERQNGGNGDGRPGRLTKRLGLALYKVKE